jgi:outer membrane autotransporter protein
LILGVPEAYDAQTQLIADGSRRISNLLMNRPRACDDGEVNPWQGSKEVLSCHARRWSAWLAGVGGFRNRDGFSGHTDYDSEIGGAVFGIDARPVGDLELTFALSSQGGKVDAQGYGDSDLVLVDLSAHAAWSWGPLRLQSVATWGYGSHDSSRDIRFDESATPVNVRGEDDHDSQHVSVSGQAGFLINTGAIDIEPLVGIDYTWIDQDEISESNAGIYGAQIDERDDDILSVVAGIRLSTIYHHTKYLHPKLEWMDGVWRPTIDLRWRETLTGDDRSVTARLQGAPTSVASFTIDGKEDKGGFEIGTGVTFVPEHANRLQFDLRYDAYRASHTVEHDLVAKVRIGF